MRSKQLRINIYETQLGDRSRRTPAEEGDLIAFAVWAMEPASKKRETYLQWAAQEQSNAENAAALGMPEEVVEKHLARAARWAEQEAVDGDWNVHYWAARWDQALIKAREYERHGYRVEIVDAKIIETTTTRRFAK